MAKTIKTDSLTDSIPNNEREKQENELSIVNKKLAFQTNEKKKKVDELAIVYKELAYRKIEKKQRADELVIANIELAYQNKEKKKREAELRVANYARSLIEASLDPLFTINPKGKITDMNSASVNIIGKSRAELLGTDFFNYFTEPKKAREGYLQVFEKGFVADYPLIIKDKKLTEVLFNGSVYKDENGAVLGVVVVARDITKQKIIEKELIEAKVFAELVTFYAEEAKIKAEDATKVAEAAVKSKQQFLSNMSHEIRTPMNAIIGFTKVLLKTELSAKQKEYLNAIKLSGDVLIVLINNILDLAKVDSGKITFEQIPFKLDFSISAMLHLFETTIQEKNIQLIKSFDSNIPEVLLGDSVRLHQIILNLMSNAVKFTTEGSITFSVKILNEEEEKVNLLFSVSDTGIGISDEEITTIFENFQQATSGTSRLYGGTGLGLAIVKQLVEAQGGTVKVKSKLNVGSTFSFELSFQKTKEEVEIAIENIETNTDAKKIRVLVVEDMPLNQLLMKTLLDDFGFEKEIASNGKIALEKLSQKNASGDIEVFDIILMDIQMPEMNGFEATEYIRNTLKLKIPIIALTADVTTVDLEKCKKVGMDDYIAKPVDEKLLKSKILKLVQKNRPKIDLPKTEKCIDLAYMNKITKSNPLLMIEMISIYLKQTPPLIEIMKKCLVNKNWNSLKTSIHKTLPSFSIMGINKKFENTAREIMEHTFGNQEIIKNNEKTLQIISVLEQSCNELKIELNILNNMQNED